MTVQATRRSVVVAAIMLLELLVALPAPAASTTINSFFDGSEAAMPERVRRDGTPTTCVAEAFPGTFDTPSFYRIFLFCNPGPASCFTVHYENGSCDIDVHLEA